MKRKRFYLFTIFTLAALLCRAADVNFVSADGAWNVTVSTDAVTITPEMFGRLIAHPSTSESMEMFTKAWTRKFGEKEITDLLP